ncbi:MAG: primosomal protein N' [Alphaproteobacteria bacterium]|nr:primosomal protein N' [Alphaproteobacteria bacterium]
MNSKNNIIISVIVPLPLTENYDYEAPPKTEVGDVVEVPFGKKKLLGVVAEIKESSGVSTDKIKAINSIIAPKVFSPEMLKFIAWVAEYTVTPLGAVLKMALCVPDAFKQFRSNKNSAVISFSEPQTNNSPVVLTEKQKEVANTLSAKINNGFNVTLLEGLTGSGKTEVYFEALAKSFQSGHQVLVLVPEIMLTTQWLERFNRRFGCNPALWHSDLSPKTRRETWKAVAAGTAKVVVGARSALFLPFADLGLIVIDEEHDQSYKQEDGVIYQARDMAIVRASIERLPVILSSATPSLESVANVSSGRYEKVFLPERYKGAMLPEITAIDMKSNPPEKIEGQQMWLSPILVNAIHETIGRGEQALLFLNRRGYAPLMLCRTCGHRMQCPNCSSWLVEHRQIGRLICHHCDYSLAIPKSCPSCGKEDALASCGPGVERLYEEVTLRYPNARTVMITSDTLGRPSEATEVVRKIADREIDIIIGTQILAKGHHFPDLTLIGVVDADLGLEGGDMRAAERTFQLINQVSGRAGRDGKKGTTYLQTYQPDNGVLKALAAGDGKAFISAETEARKILNMPPFGRLAALIISSADKEEAYKTAKDLARNAPPADMGVEVLGPAPAPLALLRGKYRFRLLVKSGRNTRLPYIIKEWLTKIDISYKVKVQVDIDPYSFM